MATNINVSIRYSTFLPVLMAAIERTTGDVLELGAGVFSTPYLHWMCKRQKRNLMTIENDEKWFNFCRKYYVSNAGRPFRHRFIFAKEWDDVDKYIRRNWDVVLVDHSPSERRIVEIEKLANLAKYIVVHDTDSHKERIYHLSKIVPLFKYRYDFKEVEPSASIFSNFIDLSNFSAIDP